MVDRKQLAIDFAKSLDFPGIEKIVLFGSVARGDDTDDSDIDVLIITKKKRINLRLKMRFTLKSWMLSINIWNIFLLR